MSAVQEWLQRPEAEVFIADMQAAADNFRERSDAKQRRGEHAESTLYLGHADGIQFVLNSVESIRKGN